MWDHDNNWKKYITWLEKNWKKSIVWILVIAVIWYGADRLWDSRGWESGFERHTIEKPTDDSLLVIPRKTLWDWLELIVVPLFLAGGVLLFNRQDALRDSTGKEEHFQEEALRVYFDAMSDLLLNHNLRMRLEENRPNGGKEPAAIDVARARVLTVLRKVDAGRQSEVLDFMRDADLLTGSAGLLKKANLSRLDLSEADLSRTNLSEAILNRISLSKANLNRAMVSPKQLKLARSLENATMPNGEKYDPDISLEEQCKLPDTDQEQPFAPGEDASP